MIKPKIITIKDNEELNKLLAQSKELTDKISEIIKKEIKPELKAARTYRRPDGNGLDVECYTIAQLKKLISGKK